MLAISNCTIARADGNLTEGWMKRVRRYLVEAARKVVNNRGEHQHDGIRGLLRPLKSCAIEAVCLPLELYAGTQVLVSRGANAMDGYV